MKSLMKRMVQTMGLGILATTAMGVAAPATARAAAFDFFLTAEGTHQGVFQGSPGAAASSSGNIAVLSYEYDVSIPFDAGSGQMTGRRQHKPLTIRKEIDSATPLFMQALVTNELLKTVTLHFVKTGQTGADSVYFTITLTNAIVSEIHMAGGEGAPASQEANMRGLNNLQQEDISFTFQKIVFTSKAGNKSATDDWQQLQ